MSAGMAVGAGTNIIGGAIKAAAAAMAQQKAFEEFQAEQARQTGYANEAGGQWRTSLQGATADTARQQMEAGRQQRLMNFANVAQVQLQPGGSHAMTMQDNAKLGAMSKSRARLGSYSDWALEQTLRDIKTQQELNRITSFAGGTAGVFPYKEDAALHAYDWLALIGNSIQQVGGAGGDTMDYFNRGTKGSAATTNKTSQAPGWGDYYDTEGRG